MDFKRVTQRHPATIYFALTFLISWVGALILVAPKLISSRPIPKMDGILMFPIMLLGPVATSIILIALTEGTAGLRDLLQRMGKWKLPAKWYLIALIIPPFLIMVVLLFLRSFVSPAFSPNFFYFGFLFGIPAGFFEEIGWMGYAFPKLRLRQKFIKASVILGFFWGLWHFPVIDFLGAASPHGRYLFPFFIAFIAILIAIRVLITWIYSNTTSIPLAQFMHAVSTGCLAMLGPSTLSPAQETLWYMMYAVLLWITGLIIILLGRRKT
jgi:membrane protease YdiL (CAAX protease family)